MVSAIHFAARSSSYIAYVDVLLVGKKYLAHRGMRLQPGSAVVPHPGYITASSSTGADRRVKFKFVILAKGDYSLTLWGDASKTYRLSYGGSTWTSWTPSSNVET